MREREKYGGRQVRCESTAPPKNIPCDKRDKISWRRNKGGSKKEEPKNIAANRIREEA